MLRSSTMGRFGAAAGATLVALVAVASARALTLEEAQERCRESVGRPAVVACMKAQRGRGDLEACRALATPKVRACVMQALGAANSRANIAVPLPAADDSTPVPADATQLPDEAPVRFVPPPRTIADITAILDSEKPDPQRIEELKARADARPPSAGSAEQQGRFYYDRGVIRAQLGRLADAQADADKAVELARLMGDAPLQGRVRQFAAIQLQTSGNPKAALAMNELQIRDATGKGAKGLQFGGNIRASQIHIQLGDVAQAEAYLRRNLALIQEARTSPMPAWRTAYSQLGHWFEGQVESNRANVLEARGLLGQAEAAFRLAERRLRAGMPGLLGYNNPPPRNELQAQIDITVLDQARTKALQGRLAEAEVDTRRALLSQLRSVGKFHPLTPRFVLGLARVLIEQGRYGEAEKLVRTALGIQRTLGVAEDAQTVAGTLVVLGRVLNLARRPAEAAAVYDELDRVTARWDPQRRQALELTSARIYAHYASGQVEAGIAAAQALLEREMGRVGDKHLDAASARGALAIGLAMAGRDTEARRAFEAAIPVLLTAARDRMGDENSELVAAGSERLKDIVEGYIAMLAKGRGDAGAAAAATFQLAEAVRSQSVQGALAASAARMGAHDKALADLVRSEQDLEKQLAAHMGLLANVLALPSGQRDDQTVPQLQGEIERLRRTRATAKGEIAKRFPSYAELVEPKAPSIADVRAVLRAGEALLSFHLGRDRSFVWAVPKAGPIGFAMIEAGAAEIETRIAELRKALEPDVQTVKDIPPFDIAGAHDLYRLLLAPVEASWRSATSLIVTTNGALGLFPLGLLPTVAVTLETGAEPWFAGYRKVPWLARTHAVTQVPSAAALRTLRQLPAGSAARESLIGFGDPFFSEAQAAEAARETAPLVVASADTGVILRRRATPRTDRIDSADLARLPRLPDTSDELKAVAEALRADPARTLHLGKAAHEQAVKQADLSRYRIVAFATHGLLPGDLNGLTQPALALTAPQVAGVEGDGLLTMEEILALKLDADWVLLSACNTGAGTSSGAEALSGLGRAFFYAGTRSLLITNWSVDTVSARELVTDLFKRQSARPSLGRSEALRQAMMSLVDGGVYAPDGKPLFSYAHPLFWAPYSIIGEGG